MQEFAAEDSPSGISMRSRVAAMDWADTPLGPMSQWPTSLRTIVGLLLGSRFPMLVWWGPQLVHVYNDAYAPMIGEKHPMALGRPAPIVWTEIWHVVGPMAESVLAGGAATWSEDLLLLVDRHGGIEEAYFTFSYSPAPDDSGQVGGVLVTVQETTARVFGERQLRLLGELSDRCNQANSVAAVARAAASVFESHLADIPFSCLFVESGEGADWILAASHGLDPQALAALSGRAPAANWPLERAAMAGTEGIEVELGDRLRGLRVGPWDDAPRRALVVALRPVSRDRPYGYLVVGKSARRLPDASYSGLFHAVVERITSAMTHAIVYEEEQRRLQALAEIDRAKTVFFTNISHEFRTPLTLMLGPIEDALASGTLGGSELDLVHRNGRRLLRLVNGLLDFARIQAGRLKAQFVAVDLAAVTRDLVSAFRSAAERSGLALTTETDTFDAPVAVDVEMYETIVSNLLSNAIKFTPTGGICVALRRRAKDVELSVSDTGIGVSEVELPRLFERFHRIENTWSRTQEGSGIGLALLRDLVALHGGAVTAQSVHGHGTTITVTLPQGLVPGASQTGPAPTASGGIGSRSSALAREAAEWAWTDEEQKQALSTSIVDLEPGEAGAERLLVVDDNADMREYLMRLLGQRWKVQAVGDGAEAIEAVRRQSPDLILSDVMMPRMDGFALISALREDPLTRSIPVILVSARAGDEARIEALKAGADDYVVKPFNARELVARVESRLLRVRLRAVQTEKGERLAEVFEQAPVGIAVLRGPEHRFEFVNDDYLQLIDRRPVAGLPIRQALPELAGQGIYELLDHAYASGEVFHGRSIRVVINDSNRVPHERYFDFVYKPTLGVDRRPSGIAVVVYDVTALTEARREADRANRAKDDFLAMLGHELRNPLAPIVTALHVIRLKGVQTMEKEHAVIERQVDHLVRLVDDLMDVSRIASGKVELRKSTFDLRDAIGLALEAAAPELERQRHCLRCDFDNLPLSVHGDAARLTQVISNLLVNAAKFTPPGGNLQLLAHRNGGNVEVRVIDDGVGIAAEMLPLVFDLFAQERQPMDRSSGGLGLGLAIVKGLVHAHGGNVHATSPGKGRGSEFGFELPLADNETVARRADRASANEAAGDRRRVLVVDDNPDAADMLVHALEVHGFEARQAGDAPEALELVEKFMPEIAVIDIGLPVMNGYELAARLRAREPGMRIIAVTGYGMERELDSSQHATFEARLLKPVEMSSLVACIGPREREHQHRSDGAG